MFRVSLTIFFALLVCLPSALADDGTAISAYDPSVCAAEGGSQNATLEQTVAAAESADCLAMMEAFPRPELERVNRDHFTFSRYSFWRVKRSGANRYDAPNGTPVDMVPAGFQFRTCDKYPVRWLDPRGERQMDAARRRQAVQDVGLYRHAAA